MTDLPTNPDDSKARGETPVPLPKHQQMSLNQHIFVWSMVLIVGVLFGMGSTVNLLGGPSYSVSGIDQPTLLARSHVARKLQNAINPSRRAVSPYYNNGGGEMFELQRQEDYAENILLARQADKEGLMPNGKALQAILEDFLNTTMPDRSTRYAEVLNNLGGDRKVTEIELRQYLAERHAVKMLQETHVAPPVVPLATADIIACVGDQIELDEVVINAGPLLPEVKADDPEMVTTYEKMRAKAFRRPAARIVTFALADQDKLGDTLTITDSEIAAYYDAHKEMYKKADAPKPEVKEGDKKDDKKDEVKEPPKPEYKLLADVSGEIRAIVKRERVEAKAKELMEIFDRSLAEASVETMDLETFKKQAIKAGLTLKEGLVIAEPEQGAFLKAVGVGEMDENQIHLFTQEINFISTVIATKNNGPRVVLHVDGKREAGYREMSDPEVLKQVTSTVAGNRSYKDFIKAMEALRADAEKLGPGGLRKILATEAALKWDNAKQTDPDSKNKKGEPVTKSLLDDFRAPASELNGTVGDARLYASLLTPARPVAMAAEENDQGIPQVRLIQAISLKPAAAMPEANRSRQAEIFRRQLEQYRSILYQKDLNDRISRQ